MDKRFLAVMAKFPCGDTLIPIHENYNKCVEQQSLIHFLRHIFIGNIELCVQTTLPLKNISKVYSEKKQHNVTGPPGALSFDVKPEIARRITITAVSNELPPGHLLHSFSCNSSLV